MKALKHMACLSGPKSEVNGRKDNDKGEENSSGIEHVADPIAYFNSEKLWQHLCRNVVM